jgi:hypothetical protein
MTLSDLIAEVYTLTGRPDRVAETLSAVKSATLTCHQSDYYYKDLFESGIAFDSAAFVQQIDYRALVPRYRAFKYLRKYTPTSDTPGKELDLVVPENVMDAYATDRQDICYAAGAYIQLKSSTQEQYYLFGCYLHPDVTTASYSSWIALEYPYAIVFRAAGIVFKSIGKDEEASANKQLSDEQVGLIKLSNIVASGY